MKNFKGVYIPEAIIEDERLSFSQKALLSLLAALSDESGNVQYSDKTAADLMGISVSRISEKCKELRELGYLDSSSVENIVERLKAKSAVLKGRGYGFLTCEWCEVETAVLHAHHYPVPRSQGGTETVDICPNCHHEYHFSQNMKKVILPDGIWLEIEQAKAWYAE